MDVKRNIIMQKIQKNTKSYNVEKAFLTGCDKKTEWQLPWFIENYKKHNSIPLVIADFGMSEEMMEFAKNNCAIVMHMNKDIASGWMLKPFAMLHSPSIHTCWIDTDCEVRGDISSIFDFIKENKLCMVIDHPWTKRKGDKWHNSGVVAFTDKPAVLKAWCKHVVELDIEGDQEVLHWMMGSDALRRLRFIEDLPHKYNTLRLDEQDNNLPTDIRVMHWTGRIGNQIIKKMIESEYE